MYVEIESEYCEAWENHFEDRTDAGVKERCSGDGTHTDVGELRFELVVPPVGFGLVEHGVVSPNLDIDNAGGGTEVDGDVFVDDADDVDERGVTGTIEEGSTDLPGIEGEVEDMVDDCDSFKDVDAISSPGRHCVQASAIEGLTVKPDSGQIEIVVPSSVGLSGGNSSLDVQDGDLVEVYVDGDFSTNSKQPHVGNPGDPSQTHLYVTGDVQVSGIASEKFNAVVYAPHGTFEMNSANSEVHGAVLADEVSIGGQSRIVYDDRVGDRTLELAQGDGDVTTIYYLHVSETVMSVEEN